MAYKQKYPIASANRRIWSRILDLLICTCLIIGLDMMIIFINKVTNIDDFATWKYLLMSLVLLICDFIYFILVPYFSKYGTIMNIAFKTKIVNQDGKYIINLIKKELFIWIIIDMAIVIIGVILAFLNGKQAHELLNAITNFTINGKMNLVQIGAAILNAILTFLFLITLIIFGNTIYKSKRHTWIDTFSHTTMAYVSKIIIKDNTNNLVPKKPMPGIIEDEDVKELHNL